MAHSVGDAHPTMTSLSQTSRDPGDLGNRAALVPALDDPHLRKSKRRCGKCRMNVPIASGCWMRKRLGRGCVRSATTSFQQRRGRYLQVRRHPPLSPSFLRDNVLPAVETTLRKSPRKEGSRLTGTACAIRAARSGGLPLRKAGLLSLSLPRHSFFSRRASRSSRISREESPSEEELSLGRVFLCSQALSASSPTGSRSCAARLGAGT